MMTRNLEPASPESVGLSADSLTKIDEMIQGLIDQGNLAGAVTLVGRRGRLAHARAMGRKDLATGEPMNLDTMFRIYSMTKPVTAVAMMILHDEGLWRPEDPIAKHLPVFAEVKVLAGLDASGGPVLEEPCHPPTMAELLTHTAGFSYGFDPASPVDRLYQAVGVWRSESLTEMMERLASVPLAYQPGERWLYSLSMDVQGAIIEVLSGQSLSDFMQSRIFGPLGMTDTAFHTPPEQRGRRAIVYRLSKRRGLVPAEQPLLPESDDPPGLASGGGGLISTAMDYARFAQMLLNGGELAGARIVSGSALGQMMSSQLSEEFIARRWGVGHQQLRPGFSHGYNGVVFTDPELAGIPVGRGTYHWDGAAGTWFWVDPENDLLFVGLIQRMDPGSPPLQATTQTLMAAALLD